MAIQNIVDFIVRAKVVGAGKVKTDVNTMASSVEDGGKRVDRVLRGQAKLTRRLAAQNKKAFTLAAVGMGPLIRGYANIAASIFAVSAAWDAVGIGAKFEQTNTAFAQLASGLGLNAKIIIADLKALSANALTTQSLMENAALGLASGLSVKQLEGLTSVARKAARVMGRTLPDAYNRLLKGVTKLEPELLDELGITFKLGPALIKYARATGQASTNITQLEKVQIFANGALTEGNRKFKDITIEAATYSERLDALKSTLIDFASKTAAKATPAIVILSETIANHMKLIGTLVSAYAFYRISVFTQNKVLGKQAATEAHVISLQKQRISVLMEQTAATDTLTAAEAANDRVARQAATVRLAEVKVKRQNIKDSIAAANSTTFFALAKGKLAKAAGVLATALGFLTGIYGVLILIVGQLLYSTGALGAIWDGIFGKSVETLSERLAKLSKEQMTVNKALLDTGISAKDAISQVENNTVAIAELEGGVLVVTDRLTGAIRVMKTFGKTKIVTTTQNTELQGLINQLDNLIAKRKELINNKKDFFLGMFDVSSFADDVKKQDKVTAMGLAIAKLKSRVKKLESGTASKALQPYGFLKTGQAAISDVATQYSQADVKEPLKRALSKSDVLEGQIAHIKSLVKNEAVISSSLEEARKQLAKDILAKNTGNILGVKTFIASAVLSIEKIKAAPKILAQFQASLDKLNKPPKSTKGLVASAILDEQLRVFQLKKSAQTKDAASTTAYFSGLATIQADRFKLSAARRIADIENSGKSAEEKNALLKKITFEGAAEQTRIQLETSAVLLDNNKSRLSAVADNEKVSLSDRIAAQKDFNALVIENFKGSAEEKANLIVKLNKKLADISKGSGKDGSTGFFGSIMDDLDKLANKSVDVYGIMSSGFKEAGNIISDTLINKVGTSFGILTDKVKENFKNQLNSAQAAYAGMVDAANSAFGTDQGSIALRADRANQDLQKNRDRKVSDLTAKRNTGAIDQQGFNTGLTAINTNFNRGQQDIGINKGRNSEDANSKRHSSLLSAQKKLNKKLLAINKTYAKENGKVWDKMYGALKSTALSVIGEILKAEFTKAAAVLAVTAATEVSKLGIFSAGAAAEVGLEGTKEAAKAPVKAAGIVATITNQLGVPGLIIGGVIAAALVAAIVVAASKSFSPKTASLPTPVALTPPKLHTGGVLTGTQSETPFIGLTGEGILNRHNGMKAIGGATALNTANATGSLPSTNTSSTQVVIQFTNKSGDVQDSLTIDNFEDFLRNKGSTQMHNVSQDGYIMLDKQSITGM